MTENDGKEESVGKIVCIDGNIGAGKSTILAELKDMGYCVFPEDIKSWGSFLDKFYGDPKRWAFTFQIAILNSLCNQLVEIKELCKHNEFVFVERSPESGMVFGKVRKNCGFLTDEEFSLFEECFSRLVWYPDVKCFIETDVSVCMDRIKERGRNCEKNIDRSYLEDIKSVYKEVDFDISFAGGFDDSRHIAEEMVNILKKEEFDIVKNHMASRLREELH